MRARLHIDPDHLDSSASRFLKVGDDVETLAKRLTTEVDLTCAWAGNDEFGSTFGATYRSVATQAVDHFRGTASRLQQLGESLRSAATELRDEDEGGGASFNDIGDSL